MSTIDKTSTQGIELETTIGSITPNTAAARRTVIETQQTGMGVQLAETAWAIDKRTHARTRRGSRMPGPAVTKVNWVAARGKARVLMIVLAATALAAEIEQTAARWAVAQARIVALAVVATELVTAALHRAAARAREVAAHSAVLVA
jgi:hypothetical protein